jgi:hypothetical protein
MKKNQIIVGGIYFAKVSGRIVRVSVNEIRQNQINWDNRKQTRYYCTNLSTDRPLIIKSALRFRDVTARPSAAENDAHGGPGYMGYTMPTRDGRGEQ